MHTLIYEMVLSSLGGGEELGEANNHQQHSGYAVHHMQGIKKTLKPEPRVAKTYSETRTNYDQS